MINKFWMTSSSLARVRLTGLGLAMVLGALLMACSSRAEAPVVPPALEASPTGIVEADNSAGAVVAPYATPVESQAPGLEVADAGPDRQRPAQVVGSNGYWPGWAGIDCATYAKRPPAFCQAMKDAEVAEPSEITTGLIAITAHNKGLIWSGTRGESRLLVATWSSFIDRTPPEDGYDPGNGFRVGESMTGTRDVFVTVVPELRQFCQVRGPFTNEALRMEQLLGLAPNNGQDSRGNDREFVELWVDPRYLFRPSPDPEISDGEAELDFPESDQFVSITEDHKEWLQGFKSMSYEEAGLPWTRLGYTYDWGDPNTDVGLSEFVIKQGATVEVLSITPTQEYC